jgi:hypothetical protein
MRIADLLWATQGRFARLNNLDCKCVDVESERATKSKTRRPNGVGTRSLFVCANAIGISRMHVSAKM